MWQQETNSTTAERTDREGGVDEGGRQCLGGLRQGTRQLGPVVAGVRRVEGGGGGGARYGLAARGARDPDGLPQVLQGRSWLP